MSVAKPWNSSPVWHFHSKSVYRSLCLLSLIPISSKEGFFASPSVSHSFLISLILIRVFRLSFRLKVSTFWRKVSHSLFLSSSRHVENMPIIHQNLSLLRALKPQSSPAILKNKRRGRLFCQIWSKPRTRNAL